MLGSRRTKDFQAISGCMLLQNCGEYQICTIFFYNFKNLMLKSSIKSSIIDKKYYFKWGSLPFFENAGQKG